jgi:hypothetical protein
LSAGRPEVDIRLLHGVVAALAGHAEAGDRACVAPETDVVAARRDTAPIAMLKQAPSRATSNQPCPTPS